MNDSSRKLAISKVAPSARRTATDTVAVEEPLEIQVTAATAAGAAARSVSITMRTPGSDAELALGFLLTEGIIDSPRQVKSVALFGEPAADTGLQNIVRVEFAAGVDVDLGRLERHFYTTSSCGVCGKSSLDALRVAGARGLHRVRTRFPAKMIAGLPDLVRPHQRVFAATGGLHAAAVFGSDGEIVIVREDVGRHNAMDKAIGALFADGHLPGHNYGVFVSGRASFELMQKALVAGVPLLAAVGAPSSLAVSAAEEFGMTLIGFLRGGTFNIYAGSERIS